MPAEVDTAPTANTSPHADFRLHDDGDGIDIKGWTVRNVQDAIAASAVEEELSRELGIKLPGMLFDKSFLQLRYGARTHAHEASSPSGAPPPQLELVFNAVDALKMVGEADPNIKVKAAERWDAKTDREDVEITTIEKASDWTFSTLYVGTLHMSGRTIGDEDGGAENAGMDGVVVADGNLEPINMDALRDTSLPILFSSQVILFEDELDDNGSACYKVRIRVMPTFFFILARFFLRVDGVLIRLYDTRYYHEFGSDVVIRESVTREANLCTSLQHVHPSVLRDPDQVSQHLPLRAKKLVNIRLTP